MQALILQLGDIHIVGEQDPVLKRIPKIPAAIRSLARGVDSIVCVITGDAVFSGTEEQYLIALQCFEDLKKQIELDSVPLKCHFVIVPGNHDCDFGDSVAVRDSVLSSIHEKPFLLADHSHLEICLGPLKRFFDFRNALDLLSIRNSDSASGGRIISDHTLHLNGETISFRCYNSAIMSVRRETSGKLLFPVSLIRNSENQD